MSRVGLFQRRMGIGGPCTPEMQSPAESKRHTCQGRRRADILILLLFQGSMIAWLLSVSPSRGSDRSPAREGLQRPIKTHCSLLRLPGPPLPICHVSAAWCFLPGPGLRQECRWTSRPPWSIISKGREGTHTSAEARLRSHPGSLPPPSRAPATSQEQGRPQWLAPRTPSSGARQVLGGGYGCRVSAERGRQ